MTFEESKEILRAFDREGVRYALVGSMAMAAQGIVRATRDMTSLSHRNLRTWAG